VIALVDYGAGNLTSVRKALTSLGARFWTPVSARELARADKIIVPGVGHFDSTKALTAEWRDAIGMAVERDETPLLGICVGLQWLFAGSSEAPKVPGLNLFPGTCFHLSDSNAGLKVPHVGWNSLEVEEPTPLMTGFKSGTQVYFTHSYAAPVTIDTVATCHYGVPFSAAMQSGNVAAVQFHPEKSGEAGLTILSNWLTRVKWPADVV